MLRWSEAIRNQDYTYFCKAAIRHSFTYFKATHLHENKIKYIQEQFTLITPRFHGLF